MSTTRRAGHGAAGVTATTKTEHAVVIDGGLLCVVSCWPRHQIVVLSPRDDEEGYPHATYHVDGTRQFRSRLGTGSSRGPGGKYDEVRGLPRLDAPMPGPVNVFALTVLSGDAAKSYSRARYSSIVEIPRAAFDRGQVIVSVDIVTLDAAAPEQPYCERFLEADLAGTCPAVRVTVWSPRPNSMT